MDPPLQSIRYRQIALLWRLLNDSSSKLSKLLWRTWQLICLQQCSYSRHPGTSGAHGTQLLGQSIVCRTRRTDKSASLNPDKALTQNRIILLRVDKNEQVIP